jgi:hypothetical protein
MSVHSGKTLFPHASSNLRVPMYSEHFSCSTCTQFLEDNHRDDDCFVCLKPRGRPTYTERNHVLLSSLPMGKKWGIGTLWPVMLIVSSSKSSSRPTGYGRRAFSFCFREWLGMSCWGDDRRDLC